MRANHVPLYSLLILIAVLGAFAAPAQAQPIRYKMERDASGTYRVYMRSTTSFTSSILGTGQVTLLVPTGTFTNLPQGTGAPTVTSYVGVWGANTRTDAGVITGAQNGTTTVSPPPNTDFISFGLGGPVTVPGRIQAGREILLFSFTTPATCSDLAQLWEPGDPTTLSFGTGTTNPGNQLSISGNGAGNAYVGNYGIDPICTVADIISSLGPVPPLTAGQTVNLPVSLSNIGNAPTTDPLTFLTTLPANFTAPAAFSNNGWGCTTTGQSVSCTNPGPLAPAGTTNFTIPITPLPASVGTTPSFTATVPTTTDGNSSNNSPAPAGGQSVQGQPDLVSSVGPVPNLVVGQTASLPVSVSNIGTGPAAGPLGFVTTLPANFTAPVTFAAANGWGCTTTGQSVSCTNPSALTAGASTNFTIPITPNSNAVNTTPTFSGTTTTPTPESTTANNAAPAVTPAQPVQGQPDLVSSVGPVPPLTVGQTASLPVSVSNIGNAPAAGPITFTTTLPTGISAPATFPAGNGWGCTTTGQVVSCTNTSPLAASTSTSLTIPITPLPASAGTTPAFSGTSATPTPESTTANNTAPSVTPAQPIQGQPDLVSSVGPVPQLVAGQTASLPVSVSNIGNAPAAGPITFTTTLPANFTAPAAFSNNGWGCTTTGQVVSCTNTSPLAASASTNFTIPVTPNSSAVNTTPTFSGTTATPTPESNTANNGAPATSPSGPVLAAPAPDLISSVGPVPQLVAGQTASLPVSVSNIGTAPAAGPISFVITLPTNFTAPAAFSNNGWGCTTTGQVVSCTNTSPLAASASTNFTLPITPNSSAIGTTPTFSGTTATPTPESNTANNPAPSVTPAQPVQGQPDLISSVGPVPPLAIGQTASLPISVSNIGTGTAFGPNTFVTTLPAGISAPPSFTGANGWGCTTTGQVVSCTNPNPVNAGSASNFTIPITPQPASQGTTPTFGGTPATTTTEPNTANNPAPAAGGQTVQAAPVASTICTQTDCGTGVRYGMKLAADGRTYIVYMKSATTYPGNTARISTAQVTVKLPTGTPITNITSLQPTTTWSLNTSVVAAAESGYSLDYLSFGYSQSGAPAAFAITAEVEIPLFSFQRVPVSCTGAIALWSGFAADANPDAFQGGSTTTNPGNAMTIAGNGSANAWKCNYTCPVQCPTVQLSLVKEAPAIINQNVPFNYVFTVSNTGTGATNGLMTVTDVLPTGLQFVTGGGNGWTCQASGQTVTCTTSTPISASTNSTFTLTVNPTQTSSLTNTASLTGGGSTTTVNSQPNASSPVGPTMSPVAPAPSDLAISISLAGPLVPGQANTITATLTNIQTGLATGPQTVTITLPAGLNAPAVFTTAGGWSCTTNGTAVVCTNPATLTLNQSLTLPISVTPASSLIGNTVVVTASAAILASETNGGNNFSFTLASVIGTDLALTFGLMPALTPGGNTQLPLTITNLGQATATGSLTLNITLPAGVSLNTGVALPVGWNFVSTAAGPAGSTILTLQYLNTTGLATNATATLNLPISVGSGVNSALPFSAGVVVIASENNAANNAATATAQLAGGPDLTVTVTGPTPLFVVNQPSVVVVSVNNIGNQTANGPFTTIVTLPIGYTINQSAITPGWSVGSSVTGPGGLTLVLTNNAVSLTPGSSLTINLTATPSGTTSGVLGVIGATVNVITNEVNINNNSGSLSATPNAPGIGVTVTLPTTFVAGQPGNITLVFVNSGTSSYTGPISTQIILPVGVTIGTLPSGWIISGTTPGPNGTIIYTISNPNVNLPINGNITLVFPVTPAVSSAGTSLTVTVVTPTNPGFPATNVTVIVVSPVVAAPAPNVIINIVTPSPGFSVGQPGSVNVVFVNNGNAPATGPTNLTITLPAGMSLNTGQLPVGWTIVSTNAGPNGSIIYVLNNPTTVISGGGGTLTVNFPVIIGQTAANTAPTIVVITVPAPQTTPASTSLTINVITAPNLVLVVGQPSPTLVVGQTSTLPVTVSNTGNGTAFGPLTAQVILPAGVSLNAAQLTLPFGWALTGSAAGAGGTTILTFTNANTSGFAAGGSFLLNIPVIANASTAGTTPSFTINILPVAGQTTTLTQTVVVNVAVQNAMAADLIISGAQPSPALAVGQASTLAITIQNIGSASANGPISFQIALPTGMSLNQAQLPAGWLLTNTQATAGGSIYTLTNNSLSLAAAGGSVVVNISVTPGVLLANATMTLGLFVNGATGELNLSNNNGSIVINTPVLPQAAPDLAVSIPAGQSFALAVGQTSLISFNVSNIGTLAAAGPLTLQFLMPAGFSTNPAGFSSGGWGCTTTGNVVSCTNAGGLGLSASSALTIPVTPTGAAVGVVNPTFQIFVLAATGETILANNIGTINYVGTVAGPDLAVSFPTQSFTLTGGQTANVLVQVANLSSAASAAGPLSLTFAMPVGYFTTDPTTFVTNGWTCNTTGTNVVCASANGLSGGASTTLSIPVQPLASAGGLISNPSFVAVVAAAAGELNFSNNVAQLFYNGPVLSGGLRLAVKMLLQGPFDATSGLMNDALRTRSLLPLTHPYLTIPGNPAFTMPATVANTAMPASVTTTTGANAIVDWVLVELRSATNPAVLLSATPALLQRDGDVVSAADGVSSLLFANLPNAAYHVAVRHRNHLGVMSRQPIPLTASVTTFDFTDSTKVWKKPGASPYPQKMAAGKAMLWAGNTSGDNQVIFQGGTNDVDPIFNQVFTMQNSLLNQLANFIVTRYALSDVNLDGTTIFQGQTNEVDIIFFNVIDHPGNGSGLANFIVQQHLP